MFQGLVTARCHSLVIVCLLPLFDPSCHSLDASCHFYIFFSLAICCVFSSGLLMPCVAEIMRFVSCLKPYPALRLFDSRAMLLPTLERKLSLQYSGINKNENIDMAVEVQKKNGKKLCYSFLSAGFFPQGRTNIFRVQK